MASHTINVTVGATAIQVAPESLVMTSADDVQWAGTTAHAFSIVFDGTGPFEKNELEHALAINKQRPLSKGHFKYSVVSGSDPSVRLDPVIVVEEPPTGSNP